MSLYLWTVNFLATFQPLAPTEVRQNGYRGLELSNFLSLEKKIPNSLGTGKTVFLEDETC